MEETRRVNALAWQSLFHLSCHIIPAKTGFSLELLFARHVVPMGGRLTISFQHYFAG